MGIEKELADAVFGAPLPEIELISRFMESVGVRFPCRIMAIAAADAHPQFSGQTLPVLRLHPGLTYAFLPLVEGLLDGVADRVTGDPADCENVEGWLYATHRAIISLRRRELDEGGSDLTTEREKEARDLLIARVRRSTGWQSALDVWLSTVMKRNVIKLNSVRRRAVELLAELTAPLDLIDEVAYPFQSAIQRVYATFSYSEMPRAMRDSIGDLLPYVIEPRNPAGSGAWLANRALAYVREHYTEMISLSTVAVDAGVSESHLARVFRKQTGHTVGELLTQLRLEHARRLLGQTDDTVLTVAYDSGFGSAEHFHRLFLRRTGMTPSAWRKKARAQG